MGTDLRPGQGGGKGEETEREERETKQNRENREAWHVRGWAKVMVIIPWTKLSPVTITGIG